ncbi:hybrid sensor histidine kinase/response regulator [Luteibacter rhizovicinus DSM 16549]|uniref:histidine kinase n=1 Tax=Luteibacter rhizovicinus DSM 16549 TaxID=1440763 RepID=A0A0G9H562_9GAMM|nr:hybrid sensor histidine kinase/response regulator [Luteibacter rhizovicinus]APG03014.1 hybrid sensor histidine kinase/response regulator [Luteibacter rhizovicinus DSM 16549]KLD64975.1 histidine kinase [Luteibacter rhizovicinus DSM 16549]KLD77442.1 histidine kinase [Xanthomonas hyacinthi DSM 19077]
MRDVSVTWLERVWRRTSLVQRLTCVALVPTAISAVLLVTLLTRHQMDTLHEMGRSTADAIAQQAASVSGEALRNGERREISHISQSIVQLPQVARVRISDRDGEIIADRVNGSIDDDDSLTVSREVLDPVSHRVVGSVTVDVSVEDAIAAQRTSVQNALLWLALSLFIAVMIGWSTARWLSAPLRNLAIAVRQLGLGDRTVVVPVTDDTEIGDLQRGFNGAASQLLHAQIGMEREIAMATEELARKNAALEAASVAKARFLAAASHDLRQPLYALTLFSSGLAVDEYDPVRLNRIAHIQECVEALDHLFSELLDLSRLETGAMPAVLRDVPLDEVFEEVSVNFRMVAEQHDLRLVVRTTGLWVRCDRTMVARILNNLVSNALRYTRCGGVLVGARRRLDGSVRVDVWDTGLGIGPEHLLHIFDEFYRVESGPEAGRPESTRRGLGLGLSTVQRLAGLLGTRAMVRSQPGKGSVFSITLPEVQPGKIEPPVTAAPGGGTPRDVVGMRVLVIDDEPSILAGISFLLGSWGCEVMTAEDAQQAMEAVHQWMQPPDIVISDLRLREGTGLDVIDLLDRYYRRRPGDPPPFARVLITGETRGDYLRNVDQTTTQVLYKPVSPERLHDVMVSAWAGHHAPV